MTPSKNVSNNSMTVDIVPTSFAFSAVYQFFKLGDLFGRESASLDETHHETLGRAAKEPVDQVRHGLFCDLGPAYGRPIEIRSVLELPFDLALTMQNVEHCLHRRIRKFTIKL